jgi:t-SNARE complex subunit (syntaxin)
MEEEVHKKLKNPDQMVRGSVEGEKTANSITISRPNRIAIWSICFVVISRYIRF